MLKIAGFSGTGLTVFLAGWACSNKVKMTCSELFAVLPLQDIDQNIGLTIRVVVEGYDLVAQFG